MRVPLFEAGGWTCDFNPRKGHVFTDGSEAVLVRMGDARRLTVQRTLLARTLNLHPAPFGDVTNGGVQGGAGIDLHPKYDRAVMDGTIERHAIGWWREDGTPYMPGTRYALDGSGSPYKRIDGPHYIRAYGPAVGGWEVGDIVARFWLIACAFDVLRRYPIAPYTDHEGPEYSLGAMWKNVQGAAMHSGALGICRELSWCLRCVVEAQRVAPSRTFRAWIVRMVEMIELGQAMNGAVERHAFGQGLQQEEDEARAFGIVAGEEWCTSWQTPFLVRALREAAGLVPETTGHVRMIFMRIAPWWGSVPLVAGEDGAPPGLPRYLIVAKNGTPVVAITRGVGPARPYYDQDAFDAFREVLGEAA